MQLNSYVQIVSEFIHNLSNRFKNTHLHKYIFIPNHFHLMLQITSSNKNGVVLQVFIPHRKMDIRRKMLLSKIVDCLKLNTAK